MEEVNLNLHGGGKAEKRKSQDFYPTPPECTHALLRYFDWPEMNIWEPACGDGAMAKILSEYGHRVIATDLREDCGYGEGGVDFLDEEEPEMLNAIITNPPYRDVAEQFIRKALSGEAQIVAMLLKSQYWHAVKRMKLFRQHRPSHVLSLTWRPDFLNGAGGGAPTMECLWTVWHGRCANTTEYDLLEKPEIAA